MNFNLVFPALTFGAVLVIVLVPYLLIIDRPEAKARVGLRKRLRRMVLGHVSSVELAKEKDRLSNVPMLQRMLVQRESLFGPLKRLIEQSGSKVTVGTILLASACLFLAVYVGLAMLVHQLLAGIVLGILAGCAPIFWLRWARDKRILQFEEIFPEAIDLITRALRAGHAFTTGISMVADEVPQPVAGEFRLLYDRQNYGLPLEDALRDFAARIPVIDARFFVTAVLTQREAGGNLSEVLDNLASVMRERLEFKRNVRAKSAHGRMTGWVLAALPPALTLAFLVINPQHILVLVKDPIGVQMILLAIVLQITGTLIIRRLVDVEF